MVEIEIKYITKKNYNILKSFSSSYLSPSLDPHFFTANNSQDRSFSLGMFILSFVCTQNLYIKI